MKRLPESVTWCLKWLALGMLLLEFVGNKQELGFETWHFGNLESLVADFPWFMFAGLFSLKWY